MTQSAAKRQILVAAAGACFGLTDGDGELGRAHFERIREMVGSDSVSSIHRSVDEPRRRAALLVYAVRVVRDAPSLDAR